MLPVVALAIPIADVPEYWKVQFLENDTLKLTVNIPLSSCPTLTNCQTAYTPESGSATVKMRVYACDDDSGSEKCSPYTETSYTP